jgi:hypothetical protein
VAKKTAEEATTKKEGCRGGAKKRRPLAEAKELYA